MNIKLEHLAKRFNYEWIFRNIDFTFEEQTAYAITGPNGSGKSTLLKIISGQLSPSQGTITYTVNNNKIDIEDVYKNVSFSAPYIDLIDEFKLMECILFHFRFKPAINNLSAEEILQISGLEKHRKKTIKLFSSGMRQRLKLVLSILSDTSLLLLDEPTTNLDADGVNWYLHLIEKYSTRKIVIVASNMDREYDFCTQSLAIGDFKS